MGYSVEKSDKTWRLIYGKGKKEKKRHINKHSPECKELGFKPEMTF